MEANAPPESGKRVSLEDLSKEELIKRCERLLVLAQKAKQAKDIAQEESNELRKQLNNDAASNEIIENLTQQKLLHVTTIEDLKRQNQVLTETLHRRETELRVCDEKSNFLDNENVSYMRQVGRLTDENEQLITHLDLLERQLQECKKLGLEQQSQLLALEEANEKLQNESAEGQSNELQKMLSISLEEVKKLKSENDAMSQRNDALKMNLAEKDKNIVTISEEMKQVEELKHQLQELVDNSKVSDERLREKIEEVTRLQGSQIALEQSVRDSEAIVERLKNRLRTYHSKIVKLAGNIKTLKENKNEIFSLFKIYTDQVEDWKQQLDAASKRLYSHIESLTTENAEILAENQVLKENNAKFIEQLEAHKTDDEKSKDLRELESFRESNTKLSEEINNLLVVQDELQSQIEIVTAERDSVSHKLSKFMEKHETELKVFDDRTKRETIEYRNRIEENEKICVEYRKIITKLEDDLNVQTRELEEVKRQNCSLQEALGHNKKTEQQNADKTNEEILKLVQENAQLMETIKALEDKQNPVKDTECQTDHFDDGLERVASLKRENGELLKEMNEMNQALKERGETINKFQAHCEEVMKKLKLYESQANKNVDSIGHKDETIKTLEKEIEHLKNANKSVDEDVVDELRREIHSLKEKLNANLDSSYAESETMSTSTISRTEDMNRLKDLEGSWEERYTKLRNLAVKLKGKVRELSNELLKEQNEKNDFQQKCSNNIKTIGTLQAQSDKLEDQVESYKKQIKEYESATEANCKDKQKLAEQDELIARLRKELDDLTQEKANTEVWKKQIGAKVQTFRKELEANKVLKKEYEAKIAKLSAELQEKNQALKAESDCHQQTKHSLEHSNSERMRHSVLNLEMQDYERSVKELSQKLDKKLEDINKLRNQLEAQKSTANAVREQNKLLEERAEEMKTEMSLATAETSALKKQTVELEGMLVKKEAEMQHLTQLLETARSENEELSTELSKVIAEHQKASDGLKCEKEHLRSQLLGLQQSLRETQDVLQLKVDELETIRSDYDNYKVRAQSVLRQNQSRDVGLEEKLTEDLSALRLRCDTLQSQLTEAKDVIETLEKANESLTRDKEEMQNKYEEVSTEVDDVKCLYDQLTQQHQQTMIEHSETVRSLKVHAETLAQCYRQQLSEQEVRHNREIIELQSKMEKAPSPVEMSYAALSTMHREEGEGSENTESVTRSSMHPVPLERLLGSESEQEVSFVKKQLSEEEAKVIHLTALLADTEQDLAKHVQMNKLLKEEIRRQQRSVEREKHAENLEYLKNVVFKFVTLHNGDERSRLVPVLNTILKLSPEETQKLNLVARGEAGLRGWSNYLPLWPSASKPS